MAGLFGKNKLKEMAQKIATDDIMPYIEIVKTWHNDYHEGTLKSDKETSREQAYNRDFFINILGYTEKPADLWSFEPKATTEKGQLPDAVISYNGENISAVVELKGANIELDRPQRREGNMSPVQQGFKYKTQYRHCPFVIVSNFYEFRLYQDNQLDYEVWTLDDLIIPDNDYISFKSWYILLKADNFIAKTGISKTENMLSELRIDKEVICNKFYQHYKSTRLELLRDLWKKNEVVRNDIDFGISKAQKITDRLIFVCFAEDRGLLPDNILKQVIESAKNSAFGGSIWNVLKAFFDAIDTGSEKLEIPNGYNGGLFKSDTELNNLKISDEALLKVTELGKYDFIDDLSVEILGHIFEQSISDIEEIKEKVKDGDDLKNLAISRRKKDGIFYTPGYIVRYIVDNSLGAYLREHEEKIKKEFGLKEDILDENYTKREHEAYLEYQTFLQKIKVVDPSCGSGAFLVYVFDYLLAENERVNHILGSTIYGLEDNVKNILQNNIYGVDINEESVEITKLSLWLKTAQKGKHLTTMDSNIKCGNSLIDDPIVAGNKAFNWNVEFPEIFANGGFDVVVGNPPYVFAREKIAETEKAYYKINYQSAQYQLNTYLLFIERSLLILKQKGLCGLIVPNAWLMVYSGENLRKLIMNKYSIVNIVNLLGKSFGDANVETIIGMFQAIPASAKHVIKVFTNNEDLHSIVYSHEVVQRSFEKQPGMELRIFADDTSNALVEKLKESCWKLDEACSVKAGLKAYEKGKGTPPQSAEDVKSRPYDYDYKFNNETYRYLEGGDVFRYGIHWSGSWLWYGPQLAAPRTFNLFTGNRIIIREITSKYPRCINATFLDDDYLYNMSNICILEREDVEISLKYVLALLNSKLLSFYFMKTTAKAERKLFPKIILNDLRQFPVKKVPVDVQVTIVSMVNVLIEKNKNMRDLSERFQALIMNEFALTNLGKAFNNWWHLDFSDFVKALKVKLTLVKKDELLELWNKYQPQLVALKGEVSTLDNEIDQKVYELYELTSEEIAIVEGL